MLPGSIEAELDRPRLPAQRLWTREANRLFARANAAGVNSLDWRGPVGIVAVQLPKSAFYSSNRTGH